MYVDNAAFLLFAYVKGLANNYWLGYFDDADFLVGVVLKFQI